MTVSTARNAYKDCYDILDQALEADKGIRISFPSQGEARNQLTRINYARVLDRDLMRQIKPSPDDPEYGVSVYDGLHVTRPREEKGLWWIYIRPRVFPGKVEVLGAAE